VGESKVAKAEQSKRAEEQASKSLLCFSSQISVG
jgi:hypothetical protein